MLLARNASKFSRSQECKIASETASSLLNTNNALTVGFAGINRGYPSVVSFY